MLRTAFLVATSVSALWVGAALAQTAPQTTVAVTITNNLGASISLESLTCGTNQQCTIYQNSAAAGKNATEQVVTTDGSNSTYVQRWGGYVGTTHYACNFQLNLDATTSTNACHHVTPTLSQAAGKGPGHPACTASYGDATTSTCSNASMVFSITQ